MASRSLPLEVATKDIVESAGQSLPQPVDGVPRTHWERVVAVTCARAWKFEVLVDENALARGRYLSLMLVTQEAFPVAHPHVSIAWMPDDQEPFTAREIAKLQLKLRCILRGLICPGVAEVWLRPYGDLKFLVCDSELLAACDLAHEAFFSIRPSLPQRCEPEVPFHISWHSMV